MAFPVLGRKLRAMKRERVLKEKNLKIRTINDELLHSYHSKIYNTKTKRGQANDILGIDEIYYDGNAIKIPPNIDPESVLLQDGLNDNILALIVDSIQNPEEQFAKNELPDDVIQGLEHLQKFRQLNPSKTSKLSHNSVMGENSSRRIYPDGWELSYYPAGKKGRRGKQHHGKPNIDAIKMWVEDTKLGGMSQMQLEDEYRKVKKTEGNVTWNDDKKEALIDSIAYLVARKLWYVGRRSSRETDDQWQDRTAHMRPEAGSYESNEQWGEGGFTYTREYVYTSGEQ
jgi:hypothetical protein|tara:strand:- start:11499 stop:12353 length:855 start_codon:yes stop_codon:yes gene_type:complete